jgi:hypothetical protein
MNSRVDLESVLRDLQSLPGLYLLGAGMSAGLVPFRTSFMTAPAVDYIRNSGGFPAERPRQNMRTQRVRRAAAALSLSDYFPDRELCPGTADDFPLREMLERLNDTHVYLHMAHLLTRARATQRRSDSYEIFRRFPASLLLNYNLDGLAQTLCGRRHRILAMHGTFPTAYGDEGFERVLDSAREWGFALEPDANLLCEPERLEDLALARKLIAAFRFRAGVAALVGYSFGRQGETFDDRISLEGLITGLRGFRGPVYIFDPSPEPVRDMIADAIQSNAVIGVPVYWNVFAHAARTRLDKTDTGISLHYRCEQILDCFGAGRSFPLR